MDGDVLAVMGSKCSCGENTNVFENGEQFCSSCYLKNKAGANLMFGENAEAKTGCN